MYLEKAFHKFCLVISKQFPHLGKKIRNLEKKEISKETFTKAQLVRLSRIPLKFYLPCSVMGRVYAHSLGGAGSRPESEIIFRRLRVSHFSFFFLDSHDLNFFEFWLEWIGTGLKKRQALGKNHWPSNSKVNKLPLPHAPTRFIS